MGYGKCVPIMWLGLKLIIALQARFSLPLVRYAYTEGNPFFGSQITGTSSVMTVCFFGHAISTNWPIGALIPITNSL